ncbi:P-loop NTPase fold protein [Neptuniibacter sp. QD34_54]|uniref:KAP family P-loop NTPase fold protein n=1 Tax=Neptuniibacter sp. QD34_54 TaxID=3398208 RepID=UPI0039F53941
MKYHLPEDYSLFEEKGFEEDKLGRSDTAVLVKSIISNSEGGLVLGVDAQWGVGKTSFVKMLQADMQDNTPFIYFDAYKSDYQHNPITALAGEIYEKAAELRLPGDGAMSKVADAFRKLPNLSLSGSVNALLRISAILLAKQFGVDSLEKAANSIAGDLHKEIKEAQKELSSQNIHIENYIADKKALDEIGTSLERLAKDLVNVTNSSSTTTGGSENVVFVIDELDRCRPEYALSMLEAIKHLFLVPNIVFILVTNRKQLAASIQGVHGSNFDADLYLEKFISVSISLEPAGQELSNTDVLNFITNHAERLDISYNMEDIRILSQIVIHEKVNVRHLTKILITIGILKNSGNIYYRDSSLRELLFLVATLNVCDKQKLNTLINICREKTNTLKVDWLYNNFKTDLFRNEQGLKSTMTLFVDSTKADDFRTELISQYFVQPNKHSNPIKELILMIIRSVTCFNIN